MTASSSRHETHPPLAVAAPLGGLAGTATMKIDVDQAIAATGDRGPPIPCLDVTSVGLMQSTVGALLDGARESADRLRPCGRRQATLPATYTNGWDENESQRTAHPHESGSVYDENARQVVINIGNREKDDAFATGTRRLTGSAAVSPKRSDDVSNLPYTHETRDSTLPKASERPPADTTIHPDLPAQAFPRTVVNLTR